MDSRSSLNITNIYKIIEQYSLNIHMDNKPLCKYQNEIKGTVLCVLIKTMKKCMGMEVKHPDSVISFLSMLYYPVWTAQ
jgi:hypothetical protein